MVTLQSDLDVGNQQLVIRADVCTRENTAALDAGLPAFVDNDVVDLISSYASFTPSLIISNIMQSMQNPEIQDGGTITDNTYNSACIQDRALQIFNGYTHIFEFKEFNCAKSGNSR